MLRLKLTSTSKMPLFARRYKLHESESIIMKYIA